MASEIRANKQTNRVGLGTVTYTDTGIIVSGIVTANSLGGIGHIDVGSNIQLGNAGIITAITFAGAATRVDTSAITTNNIHSVTFQGSGSDILARSGVTNEFQYNPSARKLFVSNITGFYNSPSYDTALNILGGANVTGVVTATSFSGSGSGLTNIPSSSLSGALPAISGANLTNLPPSAPVGGASTNTVFFENDKAVAVNYQVTSTKNAMSAGPIAINAGIAVTVPSGCSWTIV